MIPEILFELCSGQKCGLRTERRTERRTDRQIDISKGGEHGIIAGSIPYCPPWGQKRSHIALPGTQIALPREDNMGSGRRMGSCLWDFIMGGGYMGSGRRSHIPSNCTFAPPPFLWFFSRVGNIGTVGEASGYRSMGRWGCELDQLDLDFSRIER